VYFSSLVIVNLNVKWYGNEFVVKESENMDRVSKPGRIANLDNSVDIITIQIE